MIVHRFVDRVFSLGRQWEGSSRGQSSSFSERVSPSLLQSRYTVVLSIDTVLFRSGVGTLSNFRVLANGSIPWHASLPDSGWDTVGYCSQWIDADSSVDYRCRCNWILDEHCDRKCVHSHRFLHGEIFILSIVYRNLPYSIQAEELRVHPLFFSIPAAIGPSFSFMLPMATPPNAIVYETKTMTMWEMVSTVDYGRSMKSPFRHHVESFSTLPVSQSQCWTWIRGRGSYSIWANIRNTPWDTTTLFLARRLPYRPLP